MVGSINRLGEHSIHHDQRRKILHHLEKRYLLFPKMGTSHSFNGAQLKNVKDPTHASDVATMNFTNTQIAKASSSSNNLKAMKDLERKLNEQINRMKTEIMNTCKTMFQLKVSGASTAPPTSSQKGGAQKKEKK